MNQHAALWVNYEDWSDCTVHSLTLNGGRSSAFGAADVVTVGISIHLPDNRTLPKIGDRIDIAGWLPGADHYAALFSGNVTDAAYEPGAGPDATNILSLTAADIMRSLDGLPIGDEPWQPEFWQYRIDRIWNLAAEQLGNPSWMEGLNYDLTPHGAKDGDLFYYAPFITATLAARDIDSQPALALLREYFAPNGHAIYYVPGGAHLSLGAAPESWPAGHGYANLFNPDPDPQGRVIPQEIILGANPAPRYWTNLGNIAHRVVVRGFRMADESAGEWKAAGGDPTKYGYAVRSISTEIYMTEFPDAEVNDPQELADYWLARVQYPAYMCEISLRFHESTAQTQTIWDALAEGGPGQCGRMLHIQGLTGSSALIAAPDTYEWILEGSEFVLTASGWDIRLSLTPTSVYRGTLPAYPDTGNSWNDLIGAHATWNDLVAAHATWIEVVDTMHPHMMAA